MRLYEVVSTCLGCLTGLAVDGLSKTSQPRIAPAAERLGPTFVKLGQALANRPDLVGPDLADELRLLQDSMAPFDTAEARAIIAEDLGAAAEPVLAVLPDRPVAAASIGQVYRVELPDRLVAVKVQRPRVAAQVEQDAALARDVAAWLETLRAPSGRRLLQPALVASCDEFFSRLREELDYNNECDNLQKFSALYGPGGPAARTLRRRGGGEVVTPVAVPGLCSSRVLTMSWVEGEPLLRRGSAALPLSELPLVSFGLRCTLSQLLDTGARCDVASRPRLVGLPPPPEAQAGPGAARRAAGGPWPANADGRRWPLPTQA